MPIVFGVQNPTLVSGFALSINWQLWEGDNQSSPGSIVGGLYDFVNATPPSPLLVTRIINTTPYPDGIWTLAWNISYLNCTPPEGRRQGLLYLTSATTFTVSASSGKTPDLVAATSAQMCGTTNGVALKATSFGLNCGVLAPEKATPTPCNAMINSADAASIYAEVTQEACYLPEVRQYNSNVTCPTSTGVPSASPGFTDCIASALTLLMVFTALIHCG